MHFDLDDLELGNRCGGLTGVGPSRLCLDWGLGDRRIPGRWSAVEGTRDGVDLLLAGVRQEERSPTRAWSTSFRWSGNRAGTSAIRVRSVNEDRVPGPWSAVSDEVVID